MTPTPAQKDSSSSDDSDSEEQIQSKKVSTRGKPIEEHKQVEDSNSSSKEVS